MASTDIPQQLFVKSFFGVSVPEALDQARSEFGPDALLLNTRESPPEARHLGRYEVVFGRYPDAVAALPAPAPDSVDDLRRQIEEIRTAITRLATPPAPAQNARSSAVEQSLIAAGLPAALSREIADAVRQRWNKRDVPEIGRPRVVSQPDPDAIVFETVAEMGTRFDVQPELGRIAAFVGPPGAGKTTTLVKLAIAKGLAIGRPVHLISCDTQRIAAADQLRTYASILGVPFLAVETASALEQDFATIPEKSLVLIDTPGYSPALLQDLGSDLAALLSRRQDIDTHLILTATQRLEDLQAATARFAVFRPSRLIFTRLDETTSFAGVFCEASRTRLPLSFFAGGQSIPEDLEAASKMRVIESLVRQLPDTLEAVA